MKDYKDVKLKMRLPTYFARSFHSHVMTDLQTFVKLQQLGGPNGEDLERCEASTSKVGDTVDASENPVNSPVEVQVVNIPLFIYRFSLHPRWCKISAINSTSKVGDFSMECDPTHTRPE